MLAYSNINEALDDLQNDGKHKSNNKLGAYGNSNSNSTNIPKPGVPTYTEAWALIEAARRMAIACDNANKGDIEDRKSTRDAVRLNWRLWTIFQAELTTNEEDGVTDEIRVNMLNLCKFVDEHTIDTMEDPSTEKVKTLIDINRNIAAGLLESLKHMQEQIDDETKTENLNQENILSTSV